MISLIILMAILALVVHLELGKVWRISIGIIYFVYFIFFTSWGAYVMPYFSSMRNWSYVDNSDYYSFRGTGVFINQSDVITNDHVVDGCKKLAVRVGDEVLKGELLKTIQPEKALTRLVYSAYKDVALIRTTAKRKYFAVASKNIPKAGDVLYFPNYTSKPGVFRIKKAKAYEINGDYLSLKSFIVSRKGNSGSPIFNEKGYLVSVLHSGSGDNFLGINPRSNSTLLMSLRDLFVGAESKIYSFDNEDVDFTKDQFFKRNVVGVLCVMR